MNLPAKLLLIYSTLFIIFLVASPFLVKPDQKTLITQAYLIPVLLYFIFTIFNLIRKKNENIVQFDIKGTKVFVFFIILIIFSGIALSTIYQESKIIEVSKNPADNPQTGLIIKTSSNPTPTPKNVAVKINSRGNPFVNLREEASLNAKVITQVKNGDQFVLISKENGWYKITDNQSLTGFIYKDYIEETNSASDSALPN